MAVVVLVLSAITDAADNQVGTWKLNVAKSKYSPGPAPKEGTLRVESEPNGLKITIHSTDAEGKPVHMEFSPKYDWQGRSRNRYAGSRYHQYEEN